MGSTFWVSWVYLMDFKILNVLKRIAMLVFFASTCFVACAQLSDTERIKVSKEEFRELLKRKNDFVPADIGKDTIIIVRYTAE